MINLLERIINILPLFAGPLLIIAPEAEADWKKYIHDYVLFLTIFAILALLRILISRYALYKATAASSPSKRRKLLGFSAGLILGIAFLLTFEYLRIGIHPYLSTALTAICIVLIASDLIAVKGFKLIALGTKTLALAGAAYLSFCWGKTVLYWQPVLVAFSLALFCSLPAQARHIEELWHTPKRRKRRKKQKFDQLLVQEFDRAMVVLSLSILIAPLPIASLAYMQLLPHNFYAVVLASVAAVPLLQKIHRHPFAEPLPFKMQLYASGISVIFVAILFVVARL